MKYIRLEVF